MEGAAVKATAVTLGTGGALGGAYGIRQAIQSSEDEVSGGFLSNSETEKEQEASDFYWRDSKYDERKAYLDSNLDVVTDDAYWNEKVAKKSTLIMSGVSARVDNEISLTDLNTAKTKNDLKTWCRNNQSRKDINDFYEDYCGRDRIVTRIPESKNDSALSTDDDYESKYTKLLSTNDSSLTTELKKIKDKNDPSESKEVLKNWCSLSLTRRYMGTHDRLYINIITFCFKD